MSRSFSVPRDKIKATLGCLRQIDLMERQRNVSRVLEQKEAELGIEPLDCTISIHVSTEILVMPIT